MTERRVLIGLAHGSRDPRSALAIESLLREVSRLQPDLVAVPAFLELSEPDLTTVVLRHGIDRAVVVPLLFTSAYHATIDVPQQVSEVARITGADLRITEPLGLGDEIEQALQQRAVEAGIADDDEVLLLAVGSTRPGANEAVQDLADRWAAGRRGQVSVGFATCEPRAATVLAGLRADGRDPAVVPLFLAPGLLLDQVLDADRVGTRRAEVLGDLLAPVVLDRMLDEENRLLARVRA